MRKRSAPRQLRQQARRDRHLRHARAAVGDDLLDLLGGRGDALAGVRLPGRDIAGALPLASSLLRQVAMRRLQAVARLLQRQALVIVGGRRSPRSSRRCGRSRSGRRRRNRTVAASATLSPGAVGDQDHVARRAPASAAARAASPGPPARRRPSAALHVAHRLLALARQQRRAARRRARQAPAR